MVQLATLGDFAFMKLHRILGILWLGLFAYAGITLLWQISRLVHSDSGVLSKPSFYFAPLLCLLCLVGVVASYYLYRGARWACMFIGSLAIFWVVASIVLLATGGAFSALSVVTGVFALVLSVILFLPRNKPVA